MFLTKDKVLQEKTALLFLLKLLILMCLLKSIFFAYNYQISDGWKVSSDNIWQVLAWSVLFDTFVLCLVNTPLLLLLFPGGRLIQGSLLRKTLSFFTAILNSVVIILNVIDIFYFRFHLQRADADLLYVLRNPFANSTALVFMLAVAVVLLFLFVCWWLYRSILQLMHHTRNSNDWKLAYLLPIVFVAIFVTTDSKRLLPNYALTRVAEPIQLPLVQNSFHSFLYSLYRSKEMRLPKNDYMSAARQQTLFSIHKKNTTVTSPKNIVLFIMESVPSEFFDSSSPHKVYMPFLDSIAGQSIFFSNAFSYSYNSNKGITAILAGLPTIIDVPLYHSNFTSLKKTAVGDMLATAGYESAFFIGDNYDDFGFAKCCKWLGIDQYYCMQDVPAYQQKEKHSLGLHDEYVLDFMQQKLKSMKEPFFTVQYNISTHYPNDLPASFKNAHPANTTAQQKSMQYYNECLQRFFRDAALQPWFTNSVFIFCSDHWVQPTTDKGRIHEVNSFRIPLFIYEPGKKGMRISSPVSQLDVMNTVLAFASVTDSIISYGENLNEIVLADRTVFTKMNAAVYQAITNEFVLGFDAMHNKTLYCYNYKTDPGLRMNLLTGGDSNLVRKLTLQMQAFLQTAVTQYRK